MMSIFINDTLGFVHQVRVYLLSTTQFDAMIGPRRPFGLQIDADAVGSGKGGLGRTIAMKAQMVQSILLALTENAHPRCLVGRGIARLGETAVANGATQEQGATVEQDLPILDLDVAQSERGLIDVIACHDFQLIQTALKFIPELIAV